MNTFMSAKGGSTSGGKEKVKARATEIETEEIDINDIPF